MPTSDSNILRTSIERVIDSYPDGDPDNQVLVQPMIANVDQSGVVMTRTIDTGGPYYVINYDATTASTESVTDGTGKHLRTAIVRKDLVTNDSVDTTQLQSTGAQAAVDLALEPLLVAINESEELIAHDSLDVEFAIDTAGDVYVFQARAIKFDPEENTVDDQTSSKPSTEPDGHQGYSANPPTLFGDRAIYGVMPDWNPTTPPAGGLALPVSRHEPDVGQ